MCALNSFDHFFLRVLFLSLNTFFDFLVNPFLLFNRTFISRSLHCLFIICFRSLCTFALLQAPPLSSNNLSTQISALAYFDSWFSCLRFFISYHFLCIFAFFLTMEYFCKPRKTHRGLPTITIFCSCFQ